MRNADEAREYLADQGHDSLLDEQVVWVLAMVEKDGLDDGIEAAMAVARMTEDMPTPDRAMVRAIRHAAALVRIGLDR